MCYYLNIKIRQWFFIKKQGGKMKCPICGGEIFIVMENEIRCSCGETVLKRCPVCKNLHPFPLPDFCLATGKNIKMVRELEKLKETIHEKKPRWFSEVWFLIWIIICIIGIAHIFYPTDFIPRTPAIFIAGLSFIAYSSIPWLSEIWQNRYVQKRFPELLREKEELEKEIGRVKISDLK
ncbi:MAG: hypothetical protein PHE59_02545 [Patescibacteria group bacterium]|nr:hypothetical protein [Patescibacteria group bacterium]MDD5164358.1 hypothetical protein [Patescibacteria group bacterium]MDD5534274.1 hypothetical protein [Patescibacteria group bacterium]